MKSSLRRVGVLAAMVMAAALAVFISPCTVKKEKRAPGPLVVWLFSEPEAEHYYRILAEDFREETDTPLELVFKESYEMRALLPDNPGEFEDKVDLVEVDLFDLEQAAPYMTDLTPLLQSEGRSYQVPGAALEAGEFNGQQKLLPWRLAWPMMLVSKKINAPATWTEFKIKAKRASGDVIIPGLDDRELFAFVCAVVWAHGADPAKPFDDKLYKAFRWLAEISKHLRMESGAVRSSEIAAYSSNKRPTIFITWPEGLIPLILDGSLQTELRPAPFPCGRGGNCAVFFFGRYLGVPKGAAHTGDALNFIDFLLSPTSQRQMIFAQPWLPVRSGGWGDLGPRQKGYNALTVSAKNLRPPPRNLKTIEKELTRAGKRLLYENAGPWETLTEYRDALLED